ncbi:MAG: hypothetical protein II118_06910, partial [Ruminococcus sp.]|nr:hypothetical protein [Ruminococcus sp.]
IFITSKAYLENLSVRESSYEVSTDNPWLFAGNVTGLAKASTDNKSVEMTTRDILEKSKTIKLHNQRAKMNWQTRKVIN